MQVITNRAYKNRIQWQLGDVYGPFYNQVLGYMDPRVHLTVYVDGSPLVIDSAAFDAMNNRYLLYSKIEFNLEGVIQVVHHMPDPPFRGLQNPPIVNVSFGQHPDILVGS